MLFTLIFPLVGFSLVAWGIVRFIRRRRERAGLIGMSEGAPQFTSLVVPDDEPGAVELKPAQGRFAKLVFIGIFSLIWNGFVWSVLCFAILPDIVKGSGEAWFGLLFLSLFAIIGLVLIGAFIHQLLALTNPRLRLIVNRRTFRPGDLLELEWECSGNPSRLTSLTIAIEGRESATYTRGTDTSTDTHVFERTPLATLDDAVAILSGRVKIQLSVETVPTFIASHNKIEWILIVRGVIPRWPDISDDYPITILPPRTTP